MYVILLLSILQCLPKFLGETEITIPFANHIIYNDVCNEDEFRCMTSDECIPKWWRCDHIIDCQDGSDEWQQSDLNSFDYALDSLDEDEYKLRSFETKQPESDRNTTKIQSSFQSLEWCHSCDTREMFRCQLSNDCIPRGWICDGQVDCGIEDDSDEHDPQCQSIKQMVLMKNASYWQSSIEEVNPFLLLYNQTHLIYSISNVSSSYPLSNFTHLDFSPERMVMTITKNSNFCWLDRNTSFIKCVPTKMDGISSNIWKEVDEKFLPVHVNAQQIDRIEECWVTGQWYLMDRTSELLYRCDSIHCSVLIDHQILSRPLDFQIDPNQNFVFISRQGDRSRGSNQNLSPVILRMDMDDIGKIENIVQIALIEPRYLTLDRTKNRLYWIDTKLDLLEFVDYNGNDRHKLAVEGSKLNDWFSFEKRTSWSMSPFMFANDNSVYLLSTEQKQTNITNSVAQNQTANNTTMTMKVAKILTLTLIQIQVDHHNLLTKQIYRSIQTNSTTTLLYAGTSSLGSCKTIKKKIMATKASKRVLKEPLLIYSRLNPGLIKFLQLDYVSLKPQTSNNFQNISHQMVNQTTVELLLPITFSRSPITFDIDPFERKIYYLDDYDTNLLYQNLVSAQYPNYYQSSAHKISKRRKDSASIIKRIDLKSFGFIDRSVESITLDWCNQNVYLLERDRITVINIYGANNDQETNQKPQITMNNENVWKKVIIQNLIEASSLALDPELGVMFFATAAIINEASATSSNQTSSIDVNNYSYFIRKSNMDGSELKTVIELDKSSYANTLTLDLNRKHIYWCDTFDKTLNRINYDGSNSRRLLQSTRLNLANSLTYFLGSIYWTELQHGTIQRFDLELNHTQFIWRERAPLFQMKILQAGNSSDNIRKTKCDMGKERPRKSCHQLRLRTSGGDQCACDDHFEMDAFNRCRILSSEELTKKFCLPEEIYLIKSGRCIKKTLDDNLGVYKPDSVMQKRKCLAKEFSCDNGSRCIPYHWICDGHKDCHDQTDEQNICQVISHHELYHCPTGYFQCRHNNFLCIPQLWLCDRQPDCGDNDSSDEDDCFKAIF